MVRLQRKMTTMGMTMATRKEIQSIAYGNLPTQQPYSHPPVSILGEEGIRLRKTCNGVAKNHAK